MYAHFKQEKQKINKSILESNAQMRISNNKSLLGTWPIIQYTLHILTNHLQFQIKYPIHEIKLSILIIKFVKKM